MNRLRRRRAVREILGLGAVTTPQDFSNIQYSIPYQTDDMYENYSPFRPQAYYANPLYPNLPTTKSGGPIFNTLMRDPDYDFDDREDRW